MALLKSILLIEDCEELCVIIKSLLSDFEVESVTTLHEARTQLSKKKYSLVLLDIGMPDGDGMDFFSTMRSEGHLLNVPVVVITGEGKINSKLRAFSTGADDYVVKPFDPLELAARVRTRIEKQAELSNQTETLRTGSLVLNLPQQKCGYFYKNQIEPIDLTAIEIRLLVVLIKSRDAVVSRSAIIKQVWDGRAISTRTVDSHISHLRTKIRPSDMTIEAVTGRGYRLVRCENEEALR